MLSVRYLGNLFIQIISVMLLSLYAYYSYPMDKFAAYYLLCAILLIAFGLLRPAYEALIASIICIVMYAGYILYRILFEAPAFEVSWNELVWLAAFPYFAMIGGVNRGTKQAGNEDALLFFHPNTIEHMEEELVIVDERLAYLSSTAFLYTLEEDVIQSLREKQEFHLILMNIEHLDKYARLFGTDQAQILLNLMAETFKDHCDGTRSQVGKYTLAGIVHEADRAVMDSAQRMLGDRLYEIMQTRPRREMTANLKLKFGVVACPADGIEAAVLLEKAKAELTWSGVDKKGDTF